MAANCDLTDFTKKCRKIVGVGMNYMATVKNQGAPVPEKPVLFMKPIYSLIQENEDIILSRCHTKMAHEVELGIIIGKKGKYIKKADAMQYIGGYCLALDMTARCILEELRPKCLPWALGKSFDTATPVSKPLPLAKVPDPHNIPLWLNVNGEKRQCGNTSDLIFKIPYLIEFVSQYMTLEPYDLILTGTPDGSGLVFDGDCIECGLGDLVKMKFQVKKDKC